MPRLLQYRPLTTDHTPGEITVYDVISDLLAGELVRSDALHEGDRMGVQLVGLVGLIDNGKRDTEP